MTDAKMKYRKAVAAAFAEAGHDPSAIGWAMCICDTTGDRGYALGIRYPHGTDEAWETADRARQACESLRPDDHLPPPESSIDATMHFAGAANAGVEIVPPVHTG
jgi:hypothetical protein